MTYDQKIDTFARAVANALLDGPRLKRLVREVVLRTLVEQESQREQGIVKTFLDSCHDRGVSVWADDEGNLQWTNRERLGADLGAVLTLYTEPIRLRLERVRDLERYEREKLQQRERRRDTAYVAGKTA